MKLKKPICNEPLDLYKRIFKPRLIEEKMLILIRQGKFLNGFRNWSEAYQWVLQLF
jgi:hypothetical protein